MFKTLTNIASLVAQRNIDAVNKQQQKSFERLSSGNRIVSAGDDSAGLAIAETQRSHIRSIEQAERNSLDAVSFAQVAEGNANEISNILIRIRELAIQSATDTVGNQERKFIQNEVTSLTGEIERIAKAANFNGLQPISGENDKNELQFQVGIQNQDPDRITFNLANNVLTANELDVTGIDLTGRDQSLDALDVIDNALIKTHEVRARYGALQSRLHGVNTTLAVGRENLAAARSRISDVDVAKETSALVLQNIRQSMATSVLAQANTTPMQALALIPNLG